jgi:hypothetical protein
MSYYKGCTITIEVPENYDKAAITNALLDELPGIEVKVREGSSRAPTAVEAFVPENHGMAAMGEEVGGKLAPTGARTVLMIAEDVLGKFKTEK